MKGMPARTASDKPDLSVVERLARLESRALVGVELIAAATLLLRLLSSFVPGLPPELLDMKFTTAIALLLLCQGLRRSGPQASALDRRLATGLLGLVLVLAAVMLGGHLEQDTVATQPGSSMHDLTAWPTGLALMLAALSALGARTTRQPLDEAMQLGDRRMYAAKKVRKAARAA